MAKWKVRRSLAEWFVRRSPSVLFILMLTLALFLIYRNHIYRALFLQQQYDDSLIAGNVTVQVTRDLPLPEIYEPPGATARNIKISIPFESVPRGCEYIYGNAEYSFAQKIEDSLFSHQFERTRYLFRFKYDLKNRRCESSDLFFDLAAIPQQVNIYIIDVDVHKDFIEERPRRTSLRLEVIPKPALFEQPIAGHAEAALSRRTLRMAKSSTLIDTGSVEALLSPYDDLKEFLLGELARRGSDCRLHSKCTPIKAAVGVIDDPDVLQAFEGAEASGLPVELITNLDPRSPPRYTGKLAGLNIGGQENIELSKSPLYWLRGNPLDVSNTRARLPLHTKFVVFGDDLVISANPNFSFHLFYKSREMTLIYRDKTVAGIFNELFTILRTGVFYPLKIDLNDNLIILLNADRPRGYAASDLKPYVEIQTTQGVRSSAYGILYSLLSATQEDLVLLMSPITSSCAYFKRKLCLFSILKEKAEAGRLNILLNSYFYNLDSQSIDFISSPAGEISFHPKLNAIQKLFPDSYQGLHLMQMLDEPYSTHHERYGVLGSEWVLAGSSNYAAVSTINTIELIRSNELNKKLRDEIVLHSEPYFIVPKHSMSFSNRTFGGCEFIFEKDLLHPDRIYRHKKFDKSVIIEEARRKHGIELHDDAQYILPTTIPNHLNEMPPAFEARLLEKTNQSLSSYFCLRSGNQSERFYVVKLGAE